MASEPNDMPEQGNESPFDAAIATRNRATLSMVQNAIKRRDVKLAYQPVVQSQDTGRVAFYEGLIRVLDETGRVIPAGDFIGAAETHETGRMLDCLALELGLQALEEEPQLRLSINMSARSIGYPRWMNTLRNVLDNNPSCAERLILEITESSAMTVPDLVIPFMQNLQKEGISFALDDFGSGHTSFRYLREFYFDAIKIDGQFIRGIHENPDNQCLVRALFSIAEHFDMLTVGECVENAAEAAFLSDIGINCLQGYYFGTPTIVPYWRRDKEKRVG